MAEKILGKIASAEFGFIPDYQFMMGLQLEFQLGDGGYVGNGSTYSVNMSRDCEWKTIMRSEVIESIADKIKDILTAAKVNYVSELVGKTVEVTLEKDMFKDFRILTEVLE